MDDLAARASLVPASEVADGVTTSIPRSEIEEVLAENEMPIELVLDVSQLSEGEPSDTRSVAVSWERSELERLLREAQGDEVVLTFDRETLRSALEDDVEAHGLREIALALAIGGTAAAGVAATAAAEPGPMLGTAPPIVQPSGPDDRALPRTSPPALSPDDRAVPRSPVETPTPGVSPDDRAVPRMTPAAEPTLSPDDRAVPRSPVETPTPGVSPDDRAVPRMTPAAEPTPVVSPDDRAVPRGGPVEVPATGAVSDPGITWAPSPSETAVAAGLIALAITGAYFIVGGRRRPRIRPT
ncbi:MAG TPA: hypothetical protein VG144_08125 [Gaiellaceae bacterium]|nr:hypothetical protein [Gaiellaceae bacterium]